jgi:hypothetical protein
MPFPSQGLQQQLISDLIDFKIKNDFAALYKSYSWQKDVYESGFPEILALEEALTRGDMNQGISLLDVKRVARWGKLRNPGRIIGEEIILPKMTLHDGSFAPADSLATDSTAPVRLLEKSIQKGIGPTYLSKVLRFGLPQEYGAIDTRCVRVFGEGDLCIQRHKWLNLRARNDGYGWYIPKSQSAWPSAYGIWLNILRFFSHQLPKDCPHPEKFVLAGLRKRGEWACADVEMALFTYASQYI